MPVYAHYCHMCDDITEHMCKIDERKQFVPCDHCNGAAERVISAKIRRDEPTWLDDAKRQLQPDSRDAILTRTDLDRHMRTEGIEQIG